MNTQDIELPSAGRVGQGTVVEQGRAVAQVMAAARIAQEYPRDEFRARAHLIDACQRPALANVAFYRYKRGGEQVTGETIQLAREMARIWRNLDYGVVELRRDDDYHQSEMLAYAWDLEANIRSSAVFIVPHKRDRTAGVKLLTDMRDIYENNANNGARRLREAIFAVLPGWFRFEAAELCRATIRDGGGTPLVERVTKMLATFRKLGVDEAALVRKLGNRERREWDHDDCADLLVIHGSILKSDVRVEDEFPPPPVTVAELAPIPSTGEPSNV